MSALTCLFGPPFDLIGEAYLPDNSFTFHVAFDSLQDQELVFAYQWFLDKAILIDEEAQQISSMTSDGPHKIGVRILTAEGWSGIRSLDFFANSVPGSLSIQGPAQVLEGATTTYEAYLSFGNNVPVRVTDKTQFSISQGGVFDFNQLTTFRDDIDFNDKYATITAVMEGGLTQTLPITILNTSVRYPSVLVFDIFDDVSLNASALIANAEVAVGNSLVYRGNNFLLPGSIAADAYILASDRINNGSALVWRFQFNVVKLIKEYPNIQDFMFEIRARSNANKYIYGAFGLKNHASSMVMNGSPGSYVPTIIGGNVNVQYGNYQAYVNGGANGNFNKDYLPMMIRFNYNVASATLTYTTSGQLFYSNGLAELVTKNDCPTGFSGSTVNYSLPHGAFTSEISQWDADNKALSYFNSYKQQYANNNGSCQSLQTVSIDADSNFQENGGPNNEGYFNLNVRLSEALSVDLQVNVGCEFFWNNGPNNVGGVVTVLAGNTSETLTIPFTRYNYWVTIEYTSVDYVTPNPAGGKTIIY